MALEATTAELAKYLNVTEQQLRKLEKDGVLRRTGHNAWDPTKCAAAYLRHLQDEIAVMKSDEFGLTQAQVAALLGVTDRRIRQREQEDNPPPKNDEGRYPCAALGKWLQADWRRGLGIGEDGTVYDYDAERARLTHHQANTAEIEEQRKRWELVPAEAVRLTWSDIVASARAKLIGLPSRLASAVVGKSAADVEAGARAIIHEALEELANGGDGVPHAE